MMLRRAMMMVATAVLTTAVPAHAEETRPAIDRPDIIEVGEPILITRKMLAAEMRRNTDLRDWVRLYGAPEYAEVQEIQIDPPWAPYEVRLYYVRRNGYLAFGRVHVAPSVYNYGVRKYFGPINSSVLDRLLTAQAAVNAQAQGMSTAATVPASSVVVETDPVEGVRISN